MFDGDVGENPDVSIELVAETHCLVCFVLDDSLIRGASACVNVHADERRIDGRRH